MTRRALYSHDSSSAGPPVAPFGSAPATPVAPFGSAPATPVSEADAAPVAVAAPSYAPTVANGTQADRMFMCDVHREIAGTSKVLKVLNVKVQFAYGLVAGKKMSTTGLAVENRSNPMAKSVPEGSYLLIRASNKASETGYGGLLQALRTAWPDMPDHFTPMAYVGVVRFKTSRPITDSSLVHCPQSVGPHCWLFDKWHAFERQYKCRIGRQNPCHAVLPQHSLFQPPRASHNVHRTKNRVAAREAKKCSARTVQRASVLPDRLPMRREASIHQILRNAAVQARDKKLGSRAMAAITNEFDKRVVQNGVLHLDPVAKSTVCTQRRQIDVLNILLEKEALDIMLKGANTTLTITADNTPDPRGNELNGQVYTVVSCHKLPDLAPDGYPVPIEDVLKIFPPIIRIPSGKRGYDSMQAMVKNLRLYGASKQDLLDGKIQFCPPSNFNEDGGLVLLPLSKEERSRTPLLQRTDHMVGDAGGELHKGKGAIELLKGAAASMDFWHCLLHVINLHCKKDGSALTTRAGKMLRTVATFVRDSNNWTELSHRMKVLLGKALVPSAEAVKGEREKIIDARRKLCKSQDQENALAEQVHSLGEVFQLDAKDIDTRFPIGTDIRWQYDLLVNRRLLPLIEILPLAILLFKGEGASFADLSLSKNVEAENVYMILHNPENVLLFKILALEDELVLGQAFAEARAHAPASRPYWTGGRLGRSAPARLLVAYETLVRRKRWLNVDVPILNLRVWSPVVEYARTHNLWDPNFYLSLVRHSLNRIAGWKARFSYTETVSHAIHALFGPDIEQGAKSVERTPSQAWYAALGEVYRATHWNQMEDFGRKKLVDQLRIRRHGDGNKHVTCGTGLQGEALRDHVRQVILRENPLAQSIGPPLPRMTKALKKSLVASIDDGIIEHHRFPGVAPMHDMDKASFIKRVHIPTPRQAHPKKAKLAEWLLEQTSHPSSVETLNPIGTFLLQHKTSNGGMDNPHRLALKEFSQGTAPLYAWWDTYQPFTVKIPPY